MSGPSGTSAVCEADIQAEIAVRDLLCFAPTENSFDDMWIKFAQIACITPQTSANKIRMHWIVRDTHEVLGVLAFYRVAIVL